MPNDCEFFVWDALQRAGRISQGLRWSSLGGGGELLVGEQVGSEVGQSGA